MAKISIQVKVTERKATISKMDDKSRRKTNQGKKQTAGGVNEGIEAEVSEVEQLRSWEQIRWK